MEQGERGGRGAGKGNEGKGIFLVLCVTGEGSVGEERNKLNQRAVWKNVRQ